MLRCLRRIARHPSAAAIHDAQVVVRGRITLRSGLAVPMQGLVKVIVYIDNLLLHSKTHEEHRQQLELLFNRLRNTNLKVNLPKCEFGVDNVSYLGFRLTPEASCQGQTNSKL